MVIFSGHVFSQNTIEKIEYWDYTELHKKKVWHELGDGTWHGDVKSYTYEGILEVHTLMNYGKIKSKTYYFQDGTIMQRINKNAEGKFEGRQEHYEFNNGRRYLEVTAFIENGVVKEYKHYYSANSLKFEYLNNGSSSNFKRFDKEGNLVLEVNVKDGSVSDFETFGISIANNIIEKVSINTVIVEIKDNSYYYVRTNFSREGTQTKYYILPESPISYSQDAKFQLAMELRFELSLNLKANNGEELLFAIALNNDDYDDGYNWDWSVAAVKNYLSHLNKYEGDIKSADGIVTDNEELRSQYNSLLEKMEIAYNNTGNTQVKVQQITSDLGWDENKGNLKFCKTLAGEKCIELSYLNEDGNRRKYIYTIDSKNENIISALALALENYKSEFESKFYTGKELGYFNTESNSAYYLDSYVDRNSYLKNWISFLEDLTNYMQSSSIVFSKFKSIIYDENELKKYNELLKGVTDDAQIRKIMSN